MTTTKEVSAIVKLEIDTLQTYLKDANAGVMREYHKEKYEAWLKMDTAKKENAARYRRLIAPLISPRDMGI